MQHYFSFSLINQRIIGFIELFMRSLYDDNIFALNMFVR